MLIFPDPNVETEYTDPNGSVWEFNGTGWVRQCDCDGSGGGDGGDGGDPDYGDPHWSDVVLLINCDNETTGSQNFIDASNNHSILVWNGTDIDATQSKYGSGCINLDQNTHPSGFLEIPRSTKLDLTEPFTIECWALSGNTSAGQIIANWHGSGNFCFTISLLSDWSLSCSLSADGKTNSLTLASATNSIPNNFRDWCHIALCWTGTRYMLFIDGNIADQKDASWPVHPLEKSWTIGRRYSAAGGEGQNGTTTQPFNGFVDEVRVTIGHCRYDAPFTPPGKHPAPVALKKPLIMTSDPVETQEDSNDADLSSNDSEPLGDNQ